MEADHIIALRGHHLYCERYMPWHSPERSQEYNDIESGIRDVLLRFPGTVIEVIRGVDNLCRACAKCQDDICRNPGGGEESVRKWDAIILKELGLSYGDKLTSGKLQEIVRDKAPLQFCRERCRLREKCPGNAI